MTDEQKSENDGPESGTGEGERKKSSSSFYYLRFTTTMEGVSDVPCTCVCHKRKKPREIDYAAHIQEYEHVFGEDRELLEAALRETLSYEEALKLAGFLVLVHGVKPQLDELETPIGKDIIPLSRIPCSSGEHDFYSLFLEEAYDSDAMGFDAGFYVDF